MESTKIRWILPFEGVHHFGESKQTCPPWVPLALIDETHLTCRRHREAEAMENALASASSILDQRQKIEQYKLILASVLSSNDISQAKKFIDHSKTPLLLSLLFVWFFFQVLVHSIWISIDLIPPSPYLYIKFQWFRTTSLWWSRGSSCRLSRRIWEG